MTKEDGGTLKTKYSDEFFADLELRQDLLYDRIPTSQRSEYISSALVLGSNAAQSCPKRSLVELFKEANVQLEEAEKSGRLFSTKLRAQYEADAKGHSKVVYYRESIEELAESAEISYEKALNVHLAHEYFHCLELRDHHPVNEQLPKVPLPSIFGWKRSATIMRTSEIAANAFAKAFLQLPIMPNFYDYLYLMKTGDLPNGWLDQAYTEFQQEQIV